MRWKSYAPYILALALIGLSGGVLAAVAGDTASAERLAAVEAVLPSSAPAAPVPSSVPPAVPSAVPPPSLPSLNASEQPEAATPSPAPQESWPAPEAAPPTAKAPALPSPEPPSAGPSTVLPATAALPSAAALPSTLAPSAPLLPQAVQPAPYHWFPDLYSPEVAAESTNGPAYIPDEEDLLRQSEERSAHLPVLANNIILAFYGHPGSKRMGILGEYSKEDLARLLKGYEKLYEAVSGGKGVVGAYYLIYGTCWPGGEIGYLKDSVVRSYIDYAAKEGMLVFIDHQIGKYSVADAVNRLLPFLKYPNVHLALDPEWRTTSPMKEIGTISADELNEAQAMIENYLDRERIPGVKMLVVHQFNEKMIEDRSKVRANFDRVILIHTADGFGPPALKRSSYAYNALATNMPIKGFKLFFKSSYPGAGFDDPLLTPREVLSLNPEPRVVIYQ